jgi:hypothetical protein
MSQKQKDFGGEVFCRNVVMIIIISSSKVALFVRPALLQKILPDCLELDHPVFSCLEFADPFHPEDGGDAFLRPVGSNKTHTAPHPRRRHSSNRKLFSVCLATKLYILASTIIAITVPGTVNVRHFK